MYNLKVETFPGGMTRINYYEYPVSKQSGKRTVEMVTNPFDGEKVRVVKEFSFENERSLHVSMKRSQKMVYNYALSNGWDWFVTLTFNPKKVDRYDYEACEKALKTFIDATRRKCPDMRYIFVPELHEDGAFHFHGLIADCYELEFVYSGHVKKKRRVYNIPGFKYGFTTATKVSDSKKSAGYLSKYITKALCQVSVNKKRYWASRNLELPKVEHAVVILGGNKDEILDNIYDVCSYYKEVVSPYHGMSSHLFEFSGKVTMGIENFARWILEYIV